MIPALPTLDEARRIDALRALAVLDSEPEAEFDALVLAASVVCGTPISLLSLVDSERQWFKARVGLPDAMQTPRDIAFCSHAIHAPDIFEVPDARRDPRFDDNPLVTGPTDVRFYAGAPVRLSDGSPVGTLCVIDHRPRRLNDEQRTVLARLADAAARALEGRVATRRSREVTGDLAQQHALLRVTLQAIDDAVITTDAAGAVVWLNPQAQRLTGWPPVEAKGVALPRVFSAVAGLVRHCASGADAACGDPTPSPGLTQAMLVGRTGSEYAIEHSASTIVDEAGRATGSVIVFRDVTEKRRLSEDARFRASHDALTRLGSRTHFDERVQQAWAVAQAQAQDDEHALMIIDLDHLKLINETCGHAAGDLLLQQVAAILRETMRGTDVVARVGGDEFGVLLENCPMPVAHRIAQALCDRMEQFRFVHADRRMRIGTSIGLVAVGRRWASADAAVQAADDCCCAAKAAGGNRVRMWIESDESIHARHSEMKCAAQIAQALDENRFALHAQRIEPLGHHLGGLHAEVLLRMIDADGAMVSPGLFLPAAERFQMATRIDRWVLQNTIAWMRHVSELGALERINVNLSGQSIGDREFHRWATELLVDSGSQICRRLCLEITETAAVTHIVDAASFVDQVRALGVQVALDDFGAGASSFGYLKTLKVDYLKIDGQFVRGLPDDPLDTATVRCFVDVARALGIETVAEFVDRPAALACLTEMGVDFAQGFLLHRPAPIAELIEEAATPGEANPDLRARESAGGGVAAAY